MTSFIKKHPSVSFWLFFTGWATFVLFFISPDSYFNDMHSRMDSAWFFMCGKAWMNGLIPYIDFSDSKGPLLWLIYGVGYLLSRTNYLGVFWISCLWYGLTFFYVFKTARLFLNLRRSIACTILMTFAFFNPWFHTEIRAEDFCQLFLALSLYRTCVLLYTNPQKKQVQVSFGILGACFAALFLIKFNIAAMQGVLIVFALAFLIHEKGNWLTLILALLLGGILVLFPFLVYLLSNGCFFDFIHEYVINTLHTVSEATTNTNILATSIHTESPLVTYLVEWVDLLYCPEQAIRLFFLLVGGILFLITNKRYRWMPLIASFLIFSLCVRHHFYYYYNSCAVLLLFLYIGLFSIIKKPLPKSFLPFCILVTSCLLIPAHILLYNFKILFFNNNINQQDYYKVSYIISQIDHPTLINANDGEFGFGVLAEALPAGKYWNRQVGMTEQMQHEHISLIYSGKADFIIINQRFLDRQFLDYSDIISQDALNRAGYYECCRFGETKDYLLFSKQNGLIIPESITPSLKDLFFKRNPFR